MNLYKRKCSGWFKGLAIIMIILSHYAEWWSWFYTEEGVAEIIRSGISRSGPYGVAIFLLFSGYGLAKSVGNKRVGRRFILKRLINVYIPYLVMAILIELFSQGFVTIWDILDLFYGQDFWYMTVLFSFYIAFIVIGMAFKNHHVRAVLMVIFTYCYSHHLYKAGEQDFWYISNIAFAVGVLVALYESFMKKIVDKAGIVLTILFGAGSAWVVYSALFMEYVWESPVDEIISRIIAVTIFTLFIVFLAAVWKWYDPVLPILGRYSIYLYLSHTFLFMWAINYFEFEMYLRFVIATGIIIVVSLGMGMLMELLLKPVNEKVKGV